MGHPVHHAKITRSWICSIFLQPAWFLIITIGVNFLPKGNLRPILTTYRSHFEPQKSKNKPQTGLILEQDWKKTPCRLEETRPAVDKVKFIKGANKISVTAPVHDWTSHFCGIWANLGTRDLDSDLSIFYQSWIVITIAFKLGFILWLKQQQ